MISLETLSLPAGMHTMSPCFCTMPRDASSPTFSPRLTPYSRSRQVRSMPESLRRPRKNSSSSARDCVRVSADSTALFPSEIAATYTAASCRLAQRWVPEKEWAPAPKPRYGSRFQYLRLWRRLRTRFVLIVKLFLLVTAVFFISFAWVLISTPLTWLGMFLSPLLVMPFLHFLP